MSILFTPEEIEVLRTVTSERLKTLRNRIENFKTQPDLCADKREKNIKKTEDEFSKVALIEAKIIRELSDSNNNTI